MSEKNVGCFFDDRGNEGGLGGEEFLEQMERGEGARSVGEGGRRGGKRRTSSREEGTNDEIC